MIWLSATSQLNEPAAYALAISLLVYWDFKPGPLPHVLAGATLLLQPRRLLRCKPIDAGALDLPAYENNSRSRILCPSV